MAVTANFLIVRSPITEMCCLTIKSRVTMSLPLPAFRARAREELMQAFEAKPDRGFGRVRGATQSRPPAVCAQPADVQLTPACDALRNKVVDALLTVGQGYCVRVWEGVGVCRGGKEEGGGRTEASACVCGGGVYFLKPCCNVRRCGKRLTTVET